MWVHDDKNLRLYWEWVYTWHIYLSMLGLKFIHVSKSGSSHQFALNEYIFVCIPSAIISITYENMDSVINIDCFVSCIFPGAMVSLGFWCSTWLNITTHCFHDDVIKWKHFTRYWPFVRGIHRSPVNYPHKGQWRWALMLSLICAWINGWVNKREAGDLRRPSCPLWRHCNGNFQ